jgi:hypothetical protein
MSLAEIEKAVKKLTPAELTKLAGYIARQGKLGWDAQLEEDFSHSGKHAGALSKIDAEIACETIARGFYGAKRGA